MRPTRRIYVIIDGEAEVQINGLVTDVVGPGGVIGEFALIANSPRTATVRARAALNMASFSRETFHTWVAHFPGVKAAMDETLANRVAADNKRRALQSTAVSS